MRRFSIVTVVLAVLISGCGSKSAHTSATPTADKASSTTTQPNVYAKDTANNFVDATRNVPYRLYVPNSDESSVMVVDPATQKVIDTMPVGQAPQHVVPSWDLKTLYATNNAANSLTPIDPMTSKRAGPDIPVDDPYNMYFTPDGAFAIVVAEAKQNLDFRDPHTFALKNRVHVDCPGVDHIDFSADNSYLIATCEFSGKLVKVDVKTQTVVGYLTLKPEAMPQDIKLDPQGETFYVADMMSDGIWQVSAKDFTNQGLIPTGPEAHGLYPSRDAKYLYISNRGGQGKNGNKGSVSVLDFQTHQVIKTWPIPAPSTPDMGGVSADGTTLWLSGRRSAEIYGIDTNDGHLVARVKVGKGPHGMCVWPQPGTYSLGHTGILR